jgi:hypothetical protein
MTSRMTTLERAFQMARSGQFASVAEIKKQLGQEGFSVAQVTGRVLSQQLKSLIRAAREEDPPSASGEQ